MNGGGNAWVAFVALTVLTWGTYGILLHGGQLAMADPIHGRYKAFLFVGLAYFLTAVLLPLALLWHGGATFLFPARGIWMSLFAGLVGAIGAFSVLLALGRNGSPAVVMSIVFAGAPLVNAVVAMAIGGGLHGVRWPFVVGIVMAAVGGGMVTLYRPVPTPATTAAPPSR